MYHSFGWFSEQRPAVSPYSLRVQLDWMRDHGIEIVRLSQLLDFLDGRIELPRSVAVITIDDGERNGFTVAYPIFKERGVPFALAIATEAVEQHARRGTVTWSQLREMVASGLCEIVSHSHTHRNLAVLSDRQLRRELTHSRDLIAEYVGIVPDSIAYPLGAHSDRVRAVAEELGYRAGFVAQGGLVTAATGRFEIPRYNVHRDTNIFTFAHFFSHRG